jgi:uncharacterized repeat protein (TIGR03803 family)
MKIPFVYLSRLIVVLTFLAVSTSSAAVHEQLLHGFANNPASAPDTVLISDSSGNLYGTTFSGGHQGTVFELLAQSGGGYKYQVLYTFQGKDGSEPAGRLLLDPSGTLYGTTMSGGANECGVVFRLTPGSEGTWTESTIHDFTCTDGTLSQTGLIFDSEGNLYGGTTQGGQGNGGVVFQLKPSGNGQWKLKVIDTFTYDNGRGPSSELAFDSKGNLYGGNITRIFELSPNSDGTWTESTPYTFNPPTDGQATYGVLTFDSAGNLFGTNAAGVNNSGAAWELSPNSGGWAITVLHAFSGGLDGRYAYGGLILDASGNAYGTTGRGGRFDRGVAFKLTPNGSGAWAFTVLHSFTGNKFGGIPTAGLLLDGVGNLYGTAAIGGNPACQSGCGVVFELVQ